MSDKHGDNCLECRELCGGNVDVVVRDYIFLCSHLMNRSGNSFFQEQFEKTNTYGNMVNIPPWSLDPERRDGPRNLSRTVAKLEASHTIRWLDVNPPVWFLLENRLTKTSLSYGSLCRQQRQILPQAKAQTVEA